MEAIGRQIENILLGSCSSLSNLSDKIARNDRVGTDAKVRNALVDTG